MKKRDSGGSVGGRVDGRVGAVGLRGMCAILVVLLFWWLALTTGAFVIGHAKYISI